MTARRALLWLGGGLTALLALVALLVLGLDTRPGKRFLLGQLAGFTTASGLNYRAAAIEGSIYGRMTIRGLEIHDLRGLVATSSPVVVDWSPSAYLAGGRIALAEASADTVRLLRRPELRPSDPDEPLLPDLDIDIDRLSIANLVLEPAVTGRRHIVGIAGSASIADGRATVSIDAGARIGAGIAGGDRLVLRLDAVPDQDRLVIDARLVAPATGLVDGFTRLGRPLTARWRRAATALRSPISPSLPTLAALPSRAAPIRACCSPARRNRCSARSTSTLSPALPIDASIRSPGSAARRSPSTPGASSISVKADLKIWRSMPGCCAPAPSRRTCAAMTCGWLQQSTATLARRRSRTASAPRR